MKKLIFGLTLLLFSFGCSPSVNTVKTELTYFKDVKSNQCFAYISVWTGGNSLQVSITYVPCTPEVEKLLVK